MNDWDSASRPSARTGQRLARVFGMLLVAGISAGCGRNGLPSERAVYRNACDALLRHEAFHADAVLPPIEACNIYVAKNAARIDIPLPPTLQGEGTRGDRATVWMKRIARSWVADRIVLPPTIAPAG